MIRKKSNQKNQPQPNQISYDENMEPMVFVKTFSDTLLSHPHYDKLIALYYFMYYTAKWQGTNQPKATASYIASKLRWSIRTVKKYKVMLIELGLVENIKVIDHKTKKIIGWYIKLNFIPKKTTVQKYHRVVNLHPNALSSSNTNALSSDKPLIPTIEELTPIKIFKKYLPKVFLKNKTLLPNIKEFIAHRKDMKKPLSDRAIKIICNRCKEYNTKEVQSAFETACINGNIGVFPHKEYKNNYHKKDQHAPNAVRASKDTVYGKAQYTWDGETMIPNKEMQKRIDAGETEQLT